MITGIAMGHETCRILGQVSDVLENRDSHANSSHEVSLEPTFKRRVDLGKHNV